MNYIVDITNLSRHKKVNLMYHHFKGYFQGKTNWAVQQYFGKDG